MAKNELAITPAHCNCIRSMTQVTSSAIPAHIGPACTMKRGKKKKIVSRILLHTRLETVERCTLRYCGEYASLGCVNSAFLTFFFGLKLPWV